MNRRERILDKVRHILKKHDEPMTARDIGRNLSDINTFDAVSSTVLGQWLKHEPTIRLHPTRPTSYSLVGEDS